MFEELDLTISDSKPGVTAPLISDRRSLIDCPTDVAVCPGITR